MSDFPDLGSRRSAHLYALYNAECLERFRPDRHESGFYVGMLHEDIGNVRFAFEPRLEFEGVEAELGRDVLAGLLAEFDHLGYARDPAAAVMSFVAEVLDASIDSRGLAVELYTRPAEELERRRRGGRRQEAATEDEKGLPALGHLPGWSLQRRRGGVGQLSPVPDKPPIMIPAERVRIIKLSRPVRRRWRQAVLALRDVDRSKVLGDVSRLRWAGYDFGEHTKTQELAVAGSTVSIGWDGRGTFSKYVTSHYMVYRRLKFDALWVEALEEVIRWLNGVTTDPSVLGESTFETTVSGVPTLADLGKAMRDIRPGATTLVAINDKLLMPKYASREDG